MFVNKLLHKVSRSVNAFREIYKLQGEQEIDLAALAKLLGFDVSAKMMLKRDGESVYLVVYQRQRAEPDYTIKVR